MFRKRNKTATNYNYMIYSQHMQQSNPAHKHGRFSGNVRHTECFGLNKK